MTQTTTEAAHKELSSLPIQTLEVPIIASAIEAALYNASHAPSAVGQLVNVLMHDLRDATILVGSDSTGNEAFEWVYLLASQYAYAFPRFRVEYYLWDYIEKDWPTEPEIIHDGTGSHVLRIYNGAKGGSRPDYMLGERFAKFALQELPVTADLLICNYGHNISENMTNASYVNSIVCKQIEFISAVLDYNANAGCLVIGQNPQRTNTKMGLIVDAANKVSAMLSCDYVDVYRAFEEANRDINLYMEGDVVHPNSEGQQLFLRKIWQKHFSSVGKQASTFEQVMADNLIPDEVADLSLWDGNGLPNGFVASSNAKCERETTITGDSGVASLKISAKSENINSGNVFVQHTLPTHTVNKVKGKKLFVLMRFFRPLTATPVTSGKVEILLSGTTRVATMEHDNLPIGGWHNRLISADIPTDVTSIKLNFYADSSSSPTAVIYVDSVGAFVR